MLDAQANIKRKERLLQLTQQPGWSDFMKILDGLWDEAWDVFLKAKLGNGSYDAIVGAQATFNLITNLLNEISGHIALGEKMKNKLKNKGLLLRRQDIT